MNTFVHRCVVAAVLWGIWGSIAPVFADDPQDDGRIVEPIRVLLISGHNNHNWRETTPVLKAILEEGDRFEVVVDEAPQDLTAEKLNDFDVIVSNWNWWNAGQDPGWSDDTREAYLAFIRDGKGHVVVHAGSSSFYDWDEYQKVGLASWKLGETGHGPRHDFPVQIVDTEHPITQGVEPFTIFDELWERPGVQEQATVLATGTLAYKEEEPAIQHPVVLVDDYGEGRCYTLMLGHDARAMESDGFQTLLTRGVEWAATGAVAEN